MQAAATMIATHSSNVSLLKQKERLVIGVIRSMSSAIDARDPYTCGHSERVGRYAELISEQLQQSSEFMERIYLCGLLHDVGKIGVRDEVLLKTGKLTDEEYAIMKQHPEIGYRIVESLDGFEDILPGVLHHHERYDGGGYPHGLSGESIPLIARILGVADAYDAMTSDRPYRRGMPHQKAISIIEEQSGAQFDPDAAQAFLEISKNNEKAFTQYEIRPSSLLDSQFELDVSSLVLN